MSRLLISPRHLHAIGLHAASAYPEECCGILIGRLLERTEDASEGTLVERILSAQNARPDRRNDRFLIEPETVLAAHREARAASLDIVGYYHSHPDHPAEPSEFDREHAWPGTSYLIVSVLDGRVAESRSWRLRDDRERFEEENIDPTLGAAERSLRKRARP